MSDDNITYLLFSDIRAIFMHQSPFLLPSPILLGSLNTELLRGRRRFISQLLRLCICPATSRLLAAFGRAPTAVKLSGDGHLCHRGQTDVIHDTRHDVTHDTRHVIHDTRHDVTHDTRHVIHDTRHDVTHDTT